MADYFPEIIGGSESEEDIVDDKKAVHEDKLSMDNVFVSKPIKMKIVEEVSDVPVKKERKKRIMTDLQKEKLAESRVKALETRRRNSALKKEEKELLKLQKQQQLQALRDKVKPVPQKVLHVVEEETKDRVIKQTMDKPVKMYTSEDLETATINAIAGYDKMRKQRKKIKVEENRVQAEKEAVKQKIMRIVQPQTNNPYDSCY